MTHEITRDLLTCFSRFNGITADRYELRCSNGKVAGYISVCFEPNIFIGDKDKPLVIELSCTNGNQMTMQEPNSMNITNLILSVYCVFGAAIAELPKIEKFVNSLPYTIDIEEKTNIDNAQS